MTAIRPIDESLQKIACDELNEVENRIADDILALRAWIEKQPHLNARTDDQFLISFLRGCKFSLEKAKSKIDYFYTIKTMLPDLFTSQPMDEKSLELCRAGIYVCLPQPLGVGGPRIHFTNYSKLDPKKYNVTDLFRYQYLIMDMEICSDDHSIISGNIEVIDLTKINLSLLFQFDPVLIKKLGVFSDKAEPMRLKGIHFINSPKEAQAILTLARSLLSAKIQQRFHVHKNLDELYKFIPKECLPIEYGGCNGSIPEIQAATERQLLKLNDYFAENQQFGVVEKLRPGKRIDKESLFGMDGSFRKLDID